MPLRFAFLVLQEHPYGREMLRLLLERGFRPECVVEEVSAVADEERGKFLQRSAGQPLPPTIATLLAHQDVAHHEVENHNSPACHEILGALAPDLLILGGTRILRRPILGIPSRGTVNAHPGLLPWLRGSASVGWALYKDMPVGVTTHFLDPGIDTGPIILRRELPVHRGETYEGIHRRVLTLAGELMVETMELLADGDVQVTAQDPDVGETMRVIPPELLAEAKARLAAGRYSHFAEP
jgi:methionyl-tRNA formyltransferase